MPLLKSGTEFAAKWENVYSAQIEEGLRDPIKVYELFGRYFVEEGNKRVSVLKFCKAASVMAEVREIVLETKDTKAAEIYQAFKLSESDWNRCHSDVESQKLQQTGKGPQCRYRTPIYRSRN